MNIRVGSKSFDYDALREAVAASKTVPQVCKALDIAYSPTADYAILKAANDSGFDMSHFAQRRQRAVRELSNVHPETKAAVDGFLATITRPDSLASYKYVLYDVAEALNGESIVAVGKEEIERAIGTLNSESKRKYGGSCVRSMLKYTLKADPKSRFAVKKSLLFWMLEVD